MGATHARQRTIADSQFGAGATSFAPATWYVGLSTTVPNKDGTGFTEPPSGRNYARAAVANNSTNWPAAVTTGDITTKANGTTIAFPDPTGDWGEVIEWGLFTTSTGGLPVYTNPLDGPITPRSSTQVVEFPVGMLSLPWK